jgi:3-dehydroquinate synthase
MAAVCSPPMTEIAVDLGARSYAVHVGRGLIGSLPEVLRSLEGRHFAVVSNRRVWSLHGRGVERGLAKLGRLARVLVPDGERHKSRSTLAAVQDAFVAAGLGRDGVVVAFGGGVVGDLAGFAAATYMRGVDFVQIPTTLLAMVDSSVGGKVGINHPKAKNLIGAFHQPRAVIADPTLLATLPPRELRSGAYEILKCGILGDRALFRAMAEAPQGLVGWDARAMESAIAAACALKAEVVRKDEREGGLRRVLNLGHTIGHALEAVTRYRRFTHGEAVGWGLIGAASIAGRKDLLRASAVEAIAAATDRIGRRPSVMGLALEPILAAIAHDKKARKGRVPFILPTAIGRVTIRDDVTPADVREALGAMAARRAPG